MGARYRAVYKHGKLYAEYENGVLTYLAPTYSPANRSDLPSPNIMRDIGEYKSPIDNTMITSRSAHREHMRTHDVIEVGNEPIGNAKPPELPAGRDIGESIKRHLEEVKALPQKAYDAQVKAMQHGD